MGCRLEKLDWAHVPAFLAVAETGSLSAAARRIGQSQPTIGRHIKAIERDLGATLFVREASGLKLSAAGRLLLEPAQHMAAAAARLTTLAAGQDARPSGTVRMTASVVVSHEILPPIIARLRLAEPDIDIELVPSDTSENLLFREADLAIRMFRPTQLDVVTCKIADQPIALYGAHDVIARHGQPRSMEDLKRFPFVGFDRSDLILRHMRALGFDISRTFFAVRCDDQAAFWKLVCAGCGIGAMQCVIGEAEPRVQRLTVQPELPPLPVWLAAHEALYQTPRVRRVWDFLAAELAAV